jgi:hypothetical protein
MDATAGAAAAPAPPRLLAGTRVRKRFGEHWYAGTVTGRAADVATWYHVHYDDGDSDENSATELTLLALGETVESPPPPPPPSKAPRTHARAHRRSPGGPPSPAHAFSPTSPPPAQRRGAPVAGSPAAVVSALSVADLPPPSLGPDCVASGGAAGEARLTPDGVDVPLLERYVRWLHRRQAGVGTPADAATGGATGGSSVYRHLDPVTRETGAQLRAALRPLLVADPSARGAVEVLAQALRAAVLELAIGKAATFRAWRAWQLRGTAGADAALQALPCLLPVSDADFASFEAYFSLRAPGGAGDPGLADPDEAFSASHSSRGFARTRLLVKSLRAHARAVAAELQAAVTWQAATEAVLSRPGAFAEVGPHYGGQALCCIYHGLIGGDEPGGPFRARLLQQLDPASLMQFATLAKTVRGPRWTLAAIFGESLLGQPAAQLAWLAANTAALLDWAELRDFAWLQDGRGGRRDLTAVDHAYAITAFHDKRSKLQATARA